MRAEMHMIIIIIIRSERTPNFECIDDVAVAQVSHAKHIAAVRWMQNSS